LQQQTFDKVFTREDNLKPLTCQAVTPYTKKFNNTGRSKVYTLNVQCKLFTVFMKNKIMLFE